MGVERTGPAMPVVLSVRRLHRALGARADVASQPEAHRAGRREPPTATDGRLDYELRQWSRSFGQHVRVLAPGSLRDEIAAELAHAAMLYR